MILGTTTDIEAKPYKVDLDILIESKMLVVANSGGGKSYALRRILEQTHGKIQHIILDPEGEFSTLREKFDYVYAAKAGGDVAVDYRIAKLLAHRTLELGMSIIIDIFEMEPKDRIKFVRYFLEAMVDAPKNLWHPAMVVLDEAHVFCPQKGEAESADAVINSASRFRKRGFGLILATQRIAKLNKDAAAEMNNKVIGRCGLDLDMKRAAEELGFAGRDEQHRLRSLRPGEFFCFGPASTNTVTQVTVGDIQTTHPRAGHRDVTAPPPREKIKKVLEQLSDLPREAEEEAQTVAALKTKVRELEATIRRGPVAPAPERVEVPVLKSDEIRVLSNLMSEFQTVGGKVGEAAQSLIATLQGMMSAPPGYTTLSKSHTIPPSDNKVFFSQKQDPEKWDSTGSKLGRCATAILQVLAQYPSANASQVAIFSRYSIKSSSFSNALSELRTLGLIEGDREYLQITSNGVIAAGPVDPLPRGEKLQAYWLEKLEKAERAILHAVASKPPRSYSKQEISDITGYSIKSSSFSNALSKLRILQLISGRDQIKASEELF